MKMNLMDGTYSPEDAKTLLNHLIGAKIMYLEKKISEALLEEDIKQREQRIKTLTAQRAEILQWNDSTSNAIDIHLWVELK